ncbi:MAG: PHP domain-containing protein, partial [Phycisphaeraceae bacterium]|nr:PHP domain-containing protein [Phycisphaeraceae bacterium]
ARDAKRRGFHTLAVTDHSPAAGIANGLEPKRLKKHIAAIRRADEKIKGISILAGTEVDILADGRLDYDDELLAELDLVVASPHVALGQNPDKATARLLKAIENPYVHIIGHPTGRLIGRREGMHPKMAKLFDAAAETHTALEINASDWRLDLSDVHARAALEAGVQLSINTDAHGAEDFDQLPYGVMTARRAWAEAKDVVNCLTPAKFRKWLKKKRSALT